MRTVAFILFTSLLAHADQPLTVKWSMLPGLCADREAVVTLQSGTRIEGRLLQVSPDTFSMEVVRSTNIADVAEGVHTLNRGQFKAMRIRNKRIAGRVWGTVLGVVATPYVLIPAGEASPYFILPAMLGAIGGGHMVGRAVDRRTYAVTILPDEPTP